MRWILPLLLLSCSGLACASCSSSSKVEAPAAPKVKVETPPETTTAKGTRVTTFRPPSRAPTRLKDLLVYEIVIAPSSGAVVLDRVDVVDNGGAPLAALTSTELAKTTYVFDSARKYILPTPAEIAPGNTGVVYLLHELAKGAPFPTELTAKVAVRYADSSTETATLAIPVLDTPPVVIGAPLRGTGWLASNGLSNTSNHRIAILHFTDMHVAERYAIDFIQADDAGFLTRPPHTANTDYLCYGQDLLAVGDGVVAATKDGEPDQVPGVGPEFSTVTRENIGGNFVILQLDVGGYAFYAHVVPGTLKVKVGDRVKKGDVVGLLGNTGNSTAPHLHFHIADGPDPIDSESVPFVFEQWTFVGKPTFEVLKTNKNVTWHDRPNEKVERALPTEDEGIGF